MNKNTLLIHIPLCFGFVWFINNRWQITPYVIRNYILNGVQDTTIGNTDKIDIFRYNHLCISIILILFLALFSACSTPVPTNDPVQAAVTLDAAGISRTVISGEILGGNMGAWVGGSKLNAGIAGYFKELGSGVMRFPGGNLANNFCWVDQKASDNNYTKWDDWSWGTSLKQYAAFIKQIGCAPLYSLNPFDHTINSVKHSAAAEAENIIRQLKESGITGALYFEVGNENDGAWNRQLTVDQYAEKYIAIAGAMKSKDASVKMIGPVTSSMSDPGARMQWVDGFIKRLHDAGKLELLDYFCYHHYGGWISKSNSNPVNLNDPQSLETEAAYIRSKLDQWGASGTKIALTEYNAAIWDTGCTRDQNTIRQALWLGDTIGELFEHFDLANIWITMHPGKDPHTLIDDSSGNRTKNYWPCYLAAKTLGGASPGESISILSNITSSTGMDRLAVHAVKKADNSYGILLVNKYSSNQVLLTLTLVNTAKITDTAVLVLSEKEYSSGSGPAAGTASTGDAVIRITLPAFSLTGIVCK